MAGCPAISSGGGSLDEITGGLDFRFETSNPESLVEAIMGLTYKPHLLKELKDKARRHAQAFKWAKTAEDTVSIYKNLINSG